MMGRTPRHPRCAGWAVDVTSPLICLPQILPLSNRIDRLSSPLWVPLLVMLDQGRRAPLIVSRHKNQPFMSYGDPFTKSLRGYTVPTPTTTPDSPERTLLAGWTDVELGMIILLTGLLVIFIAAMLIQSREWRPIRDRDVSGFRTESQCLPCPRRLMEIVRRRMRNR
jgi:hypothetical protein